MSAFHVNSSKENPRTGGNSREYNSADDSCQGKGNYEDKSGKINEI